MLIVITLTSLTGCWDRGEHYQGYIDGEYINLASNYPGILKQLLVLRGDLVQKKQLLFVLDEQPQAAQLAQAQEQLTQAQNILNDLVNGQRNTILQAITAQRQQAEANLQLSITNLQRYKKLLQTGAIDKATVDQAQSNYDRDVNAVKQYTANLEEAKQGARENAIKAQQAAVLAAQAAVTRSSWELAQKSVVAPIAGRIFDTYFKVGEFVNSQQPVLSLLAPENIRLIFYIPEPKRSSLSIGQIIYFTCDGCKGRTQAKINYISDIAEYTPPVIYSRESRDKLVYRVEAHMALKEAKHAYPGQPVEIYLKKE